MGNRRTLIAAAAIVLAVAAGLGVFFYVSSADQRAEQKIDLVEAFVATGDITKGTTGEAALANGLIAPAKALRDSVPPAAVVDASSLDGMVAAATIQARQYITSASFVAPSQAGGGTLAASIGDRGAVAVTINVDRAQGVAGQIAPGDRVNIALVDTSGAAQYILEAVKVLAVGTETAATATGGSGEASDTAANTGLITFELSPEDALRVAAASKSDTIYLTLLPLGVGEPGATTAGSGGADAGAVPATGR